MALIGSIAISMQVATQNFTKGLATARSQLGAFGKSSASGIGEIGSAMSAVTGATRQAVDQLVKFGAVAGMAAGFGIYKAVQAGSRLVESQNMLQQTFGESAKDVNDFNTQMANAFGTSTASFREAEGAFGGVFKAIGYTQKDAASLSVEMTRLAADMASFKNLSFQDSLDKIRSGLSGEIKPLKDVGVLIDEETVKVEAARLGFAKLGTELDIGTKVRARMSLMTKQLADAQGDLARTANEVENASRNVGGSIENLVGEIGLSLQPVAKAVLADMSAGLTVLSMMWKESGIAAVDSFSATINGAGTAAEGIGWLQKSIGFIADEWQVVRLGFLWVQGAITDGLVYMAEKFGGFAEGIGKIVNYFTGMNVAAADFTKTWIDDLKRMKVAQDETFNKALAGPAASEGVNAMFAKARQQIEGLRGGLGKPGVDVTSLVPEASGVTKRNKKEFKFGQAAEFGSKESANTQLRSIYGHGKTNKENVKTAENTTKMVGILGEMNKKLGGWNGGSEVAAF